MDKEEMEKDIEVIENKRVGRITVEPKKRLNKCLIIIAIVFTVIAIVLVSFALVNKLNSKVYNNVYIGEVNISGKTEQEVFEIVKSLATEFKNRVVTVKHEAEVTMEITPDSIDMMIDEEATVKKIMDFGRDNNIVMNNVAILKAMFKSEVIEPEYTYSEAKLTNISAEITSGVEGRVKDDSFTVDEEEYILVITRGTKGKDIVVTEFKADILSILKDKNVTEYTLKLAEREPNELDIDVVYAKVCKQAKDAYVDETVSPAVYHKHEMGISFNKEELREVLSKEENQDEGKIIRFKLTATEPNIKIQDITKNLYNDKLGSYTSSYVSSDANRASNVVLGADMLNGTIVMPGETFSFNKTMGDCGLSSRGFKSAAVFKSGKVVQEIGGGICQISSTLYVAVLYANLEIVSRSNHALPVGYVPVSLDATIYYPYLDFKFKNTREYPIKIVATTTSSRKLTIGIYGTKEDKEYTIELNSWVTSSIASKTEKQYSSSLEKGKTKVIQSGTAGYKSVAYKIVKYEGKVISKELLSQDSYGSTPKIIMIGTKEVEKEENTSTSGGTTGGTTDTDTTVGGDTSSGGTTNNTETTPTEPSTGGETTETPTNP